MVSLTHNSQPRWHLLVGPGGGTWRLDGLPPDDSPRFRLNPDQRARRLRRDWQQAGGRLTPSADLFDIGALVGQHDRTDAEDVSKVQVLLHRAGFHDIEKTEGPNGLFGLPDQEAVMSFQKHHGLRVDGNVSPGGETMSALRDELLGPGRASPLGVSDGADGLRSPHPRSQPIHRAKSEGHLSVSQATGSASPAPMLSPLPGKPLKIRNDQWGEGHFNASRKRGDVSRNDHAGVDLESSPGDRVVSPIDGTLEGFTDP